MRKVKFNDQCSIKGTGWFHGFFNGEFGPNVIVEVIEAEGEQMSKTEGYAQGNWVDSLGNSGTSKEKPVWIPKYDVRPYERGQVVTCHARGVTFLDESEPSDLCVCGHKRIEHIYEEGACRPGFVCATSCEKFKLLKE